jgi:alpha-amylase
MKDKLHDLRNAARLCPGGDSPFPGPGAHGQSEAEPIAQEDEANPVNATMFQGFEWYVPADHRHWKRLQSVMPQLKAIGVDKMWIPPGCKASWRDSNGYDIYDLYDLGEFDWKGLRATKWGMREELVDMAKAANDCEIGILWDAVLNHKAGADYAESCPAVKVDPKGLKRDTSSPACDGAT